MSHKISRRLFVASGLAALAAPAMAEPPAMSLRPLLRPPGLGAGRAAAAVEALVAEARLQEIGRAHV